MDDPYEVKLVVYLGGGIPEVSLAKEHFCDTCGGLAGPGGLLQALMSAGFRLAYLVDECKCRDEKEVTRWFLTGRDYLELCGSCRSMIDSVVELVQEGPDTNDDEAPCNYVYDNKLFCGGHYCANKPSEGETGG